MKLQKCNVHFIETIKGDSVKKILCTRGKPEVKVKKLKAIYESEDTKKLESCSMFRGSMDMPRGDGTTYTETPIKGRSSIYDETEIYDLDKDDVEDNNDSDELSFNIMTLKELKERIKMKKRKRQNLGDLKQENWISSLDNAERMEDDDFERPLSCWKLKRSKKLKRKEICTPNLALKSPEAPVESSTEENLSSQHPVQSIVRLVPINVKTEVLDALDSQIVLGNDAFTYGSFVEMDLCMECLDEVPERVNRSELETKESTHSVEDTSCGLNDVSDEYVEFDESFSFSISRRLGEITETGVSGTTSHEVLPSFASESLEEGNTLSSLPSYGPSEAVTNELGSETCSSYTSDFTQLGNSTTNMDGVPAPNDLGSEAYSSYASNPTQPRNGTTIPDEVSAPNDLGSEPYSSYASDSTQQEEISCHMNDTTTPEAIPVTNDLGSETYSNYTSDSQQEEMLCLVNNFTVPEVPLTNDLGSQISSCASASTQQEQEEILCQINKFQCMDLSYDSYVGIRNTDEKYDGEVDTTLDLKPDIVESYTVHIPDEESTDTVQCVESNNGGKESAFGIDKEGNVQEDTPRKFDLLHLSQNSELYFNPQSASDFPDDDLTTTGQQQQQSALTSNEVNVTCVCAELKCPDADKKIETPPKRIFSTRKVISPTSQEKLCQAAEAEELYANMETSSCREKLCFEKQSNDSSVTSNNEVDKVSKSPERTIKALKNESQLEVPKGILKDPNVSNVTPPSGSESHSLHSCTQKAIKFSQMQMHDIENLTMKLTKELKSMTDIVEEFVCSETFSPTSSKYTADEIRMAVKDATGVQEKTQKWLSLMTKDCNRFCKIMKSGEKKAGRASGHGYHKEKKRIMFADEAGGTLCHVKVIGDLVPSLSQSVDSQL